MESSVSSSHEVAELKNQMLEMQMEIDILKETIKKDPGIEQTALSNMEKAVMIDALKINYSLPRLFGKLNLSKSSYYYLEKIMSQPDKYFSLRIRIKELFTVETDMVTAGYMPCSSVDTPLFPRRLSASYYPDSEPYRASR